MHRYRSHTCAQLRKSDEGATVRLSGWVHRVRDHGGVLFIDLRDHYGMTQVVCRSGFAGLRRAEKVRSEWVIRIDGKVKARRRDRERQLATGEIEVFADASKFWVLGRELPLPVFGEPEYPEDTRLKYRFLDLRRDKLHSNIDAAHEGHRRPCAGACDDQGFTEFQTPILTASSPEGARDFLVPSRLHPGKFYALPQAPQQYKQLLMVAGFDRYFQIAPCFRDEDPRADRLPGEFYQLDLEMSFVEQEDVSPPWSR
jgi:aspartyl-tRNA synthetase